MFGQLPPGTRVFLRRRGIEAVVDELLGVGGQGEVYRVHADAEQFALKWYFPNVPAQLRDSIGYLLDRGSPSDRFLWPLDLAEAAYGSAFGYVMQLRPDEFTGLPDLLSGRVDAPFSVLAEAGFELADSFLRLHSLGLCYRDISYGNAFLDAATGRILICDNDNVGIDGVSVSNVRGTPYFMAPEIVRGTAVPSRKTDLHSLAVLLFYLLVFHNPLEGSAEFGFQGFDAQVQDHLFGTHPVFIFDPVDPSNAPDPTWHPNPLIFWPMLPGFIRRLFETAFTDGLHDPDKRVTESQWRRAMCQLASSIVFCQHCGKQNMFDDRPLSCWQCGTPVATPPHLAVNGFRIMLNLETTIYSHHLDLDYDRADPMGTVARHPQDPGIWGLRNLSTTPWSVTDKDGNTRSVEPGRSVSLMAGVSIDFGPAIGTLGV